ncbi:hypothetical protein GCM10011387_32430 [Pedobacter quisquiliarum]|jgi:hypothetical protein|uniref:MobA/VirD2-like nuclease domain-containing protein n=1 Tax=Pedobacter quisquiliarum TaxID=1834438 RepID=A0A916UME3_9SPHI|nr:relaxase/mobilization nuclease domain-containing protein [Pedobacter quisquiliarum]GGC76159.1 hypothetical protein GCM10011387_32430 [Pedobacter quisquiliarum]
MPTANANTGNGFAKAISYALQETKKYPEETRAKLLELNQVYGSSREMGKQMREVADERKTAQKPVLHVQINFHPDEKLSRAQAEQAIDSILKDIGIEKDNHQYVVVQHKDKAHDHYHVVANRIGMDGELLNDHRIKDRLQVACDKVEQLQQLRPTTGRTVVYDPSLKKGFRYVKTQKQQKEQKPVRDKNPAIMDTKNEIRIALTEVLSKEEVKNPEQLREALGKRGIDVQLSQNKNGISGVSFRKDEIAVKGSAAGYRWADISEALSENQAKSERLENVNPHRLKSSLAVHLEGQKEQSLFIKGDSKTPGIQVPKFESHSAGIRPEVKDPSAGLQPTKQEQQEVDFAKEYNPKAQGAIREIKAELEKGNTSLDVNSVMAKHGFKAEQDQFVYSSGGMQKGIPNNAFDHAVKGVKQQQQIFKGIESKYNDLMKKAPEKIGLLDKLSGKASEKEKANSNLEREKINAIKPEFKPRVYGLEERDFEVRPKFEQRQFEHNRQQEFKKSISPSKEQDQSKGLSR